MGGCIEVYIVLSKFGKYEVLLLMVTFGTRGTVALRQFFLSL